MKSTFPIVHILVSVFLIPTTPILGNKVYEQVELQSPHDARGTYEDESVCSWVLTVRQPHRVTNVYIYAHYTNTGYNLLQITHARTHARTHAHTYTHTPARALRTKAFCRVSFSTDGISTLFSRKKNKLKIICRE